MTEAKYDFSYTASTLRIKDFITICEQYYNGGKLGLGLNKHTTEKRLLIALERRVRNLTKNQLSFLLSADYPTQKQLTFLAVCKTHLFIADFVMEVLREKLLLFDYELREGEYNTFYRRKCDQIEQLEDFTDQTKYKLKQVLFKILEQAGYIDSVSNKMIQPQILSPELIKVVAEDDKNWLKVFFMSDLDIKNVSV